MTPQAIGTSAEKSGKGGNRSDRERDGGGGRESSAANGGGQGAGAGAGVVTGAGAGAGEVLDDTVYYDCFDLKIVYERNKTGFEETKVCLSRALNRRASVEPLI
jgi:hypothetical protein